ncbi:hypothetical protein [Hymenobacter negativus]|uniref:hypothetical protein n=1 Tax=Hymenobacter negativus TaxID=2795026 RepID=UPI0018DBD978|nr:hypothetical protein [Hymenobacter negativus]
MPVPSRPAPARPGPLPDAWHPALTCFHTSLLPPPLPEAPRSRQQGEVPYKPARLLAVLEGIAYSSNLAQAQVQITETTTYNSAFTARRAVL